MFVQSAKRLSLKLIKKFRIRKIGSKPPSTSSTVARNALRCCPRRRKFSSATDSWTLLHSTVITPHNNPDESAPIHAYGGLATRLESLSGLSSDKVTRDLCDTFIDNLGDLNARNAIFNAVTHGSDVCANLEFIEDTRIKRDIGFVLHRHMKAFYENLPILLVNPFIFGLLHDYRGIGIIPFLTYRFAFQLQQLNPQFACMLVMPSFNTSFIPLTWCRFSDYTPHVEIKELGSGKRFRMAPLTDLGKFLRDQVSATLYSDYPKQDYIRGLEWPTYDMGITLSHATSKTDLVFGVDAKRKPEIFSRLLHPEEKPGQKAVRGKNSFFSIVPVSDDNTSRFIKTAHMLYDQTKEKLGAEFVCKNADEHTRKFKADLTQSVAPNQKPTYVVMPPLSNRQSHTRWISVTPPIILKGSFYGNNFHDRGNYFLEQHFLQDLSPARRQKLASMLYEKYVCGPESFEPKGNMTYEKFVERFTPTDDVQSVLNLILYQGPEQSQSSRRTVGFVFSEVHDDMQDEYGNDFVLLKIGLGCMREGTHSNNVIPPFLRCLVCATQLQHPDKPLVVFFKAFNERIYTSHARRIKTLFPNLNLEYHLSDYGEKLLYETIANRLGITVVRDDCFKPLEKPFQDYPDLLVSVSDRSAAYIFKDVYLKEGHYAALRIDGGYELSNAQAIYSDMEKDIKMLYTDPLNTIPTNFIKIQDLFSLPRSVAEKLGFPGVETHHVNRAAGGGLPCAFELTEEVFKDFLHVQCREELSRRYSSCSFFANQHVWDGVSKIPPNKLTLADPDYNRLFHERQRTCMEKVMQLFPGSFFHHQPRFYGHPESIADILSNLRKKRSLQTLLTTRP